jgi:NAD(P)-dependent dehydrogenase (short-subunit alcohol dehydrogenase family)
MSQPKNIILTGASRGIGLAIAVHLLRASHKVFLVARSAGPMEKLKSEYPAQVEFLAADLADFSVYFVFNLESWDFLGNPSSVAELRLDRQFEAKWESSVFQLVFRKILKPMSLPAGLVVIISGFLDASITA